jgi:hypothetical protein
MGHLCRASAPADWKVFYNRTPIDLTRIDLTQQVSPSAVSVVSGFMDVAGGSNTAGFACLRASS